jgi:hypothetical protein
VIEERREQFAHVDLVTVGGLHEHATASLDEQPLVGLLRRGRIPLAEVDASPVEIDEGEVSTVRPLEASVCRFRLLVGAWRPGRADFVRRHGRGSCGSVYVSVYGPDLAYGRAVLGRVVATRDVSVTCDKRVKGVEPSTFTLAT